MNTVKDITPRIIVNRTDASLNEMGITYNQAGITYNQIGFIYGGYSGSNFIFPSHSSAKDIHP